MTIPNSINWPKLFDFLSHEPLADSIIFSEELGSDIEDVTQSTTNELIDFAPYVRLIGLNAINDASKNPSELFYRAVEHTGHSERCLQYIYTYERQEGFVEPRSLGIITWVLIQLLIPNLLEFRTLLDLIGSSLVLICVGLYLFLFGLESHREDYERIKKGFRLRPRIRTPFVWFGSLLIGYNWLLSPLYIFWLYFLSNIVFLGYFVVERLGKLTAHKMDYAPVFVYIRKDLQTNNWIFHRACWDKYHYRVDGVDVDLDTVDQQLADSKNVMLKIDNLWHDFTPLYASDERDFRSSGNNQKLVGHDHASKIIKYQIWGSSILLLGLFFAFFELVFNTQTEGLGSPPLIILVGTAILTATLFHQFIYLQTKTDRNTVPRNYSKSIKIGLPELHLDHPKLMKLWNLKKKSTRLKITERMQNPFVQNEGCFDRFGSETSWRSRIRQFFKLGTSEIEG